MKFQDVRFGCLVAIGAALAVVPALPIGFGGRARAAEAPADPPAENDRPHELIQRLMRPEAEAKDRVQAIVELVARGSEGTAEARKRLGDRLDELDAVVAAAPAQDAQRRQNRRVAQDAHPAARGSETKPRRPAKQGRAGAQRAVLAVRPVAVANAPGCQAADRGGGGARAG